MSDQPTPPLAERAKRMIGPALRVAVVLACFVGIPLLVMQTTINSGAVTPELAPIVRWALIAVCAVGALGAFQVLRGLQDEP